jgi:hypothetical protein
MSWLEHGRWQSLQLVSCPRKPAINAATLGDFAQVDVSYEYEAAIGALNTAIGIMSPQTPPD